MDFWIRVRVVKELGCDVGDGHRRDPLACVLSAVPHDDRTILSEIPRLIRSRDRERVDIARPDRVSDVCFGNQIGVCRDLCVHVGVDIRELLVSCEPVLVVG